MVSDTVSVKMSRGGISDLNNFNSSWGETSDLISVDSNWGGVSDLNNNDSESWSGTRDPIGIGPAPALFRNWDGINENMER